MGDQVRGRSPNGDKLEGNNETIFIFIADRDDQY